MKKKNKKIRRVKLKQIQQPVNNSLDNSHRADPHGRQRHLRKTRARPMHIQWNIFIGQQHGEITKA